MSWILFICYLILCTFNEAGRLVVMRFFTTRWLIVMSLPFHPIQGYSPIYLPPPTLFDLYGFGLLLEVGLDLRLCTWAPTKNLLDPFIDYLGDPRKKVQTLETGVSMLPFSVQAEYLKFTLLAEVYSCYCYPGFCLGCWSLL